MVDAEALIIQRISFATWAKEKINIIDAWSRRKLTSNHHSNLLSNLGGAYLTSFAQEYRK